MKPLMLAACIAITMLAANASAHADFRVIQWFYGDCKIWGGGRPPLVGGWRALTPPIPDYGTARHVLQRFYDRRICY